MSSAEPRSAARVVQSPIGPLRLEGTAAGLTAIGFDAAPETDGDAGSGGGGDRVLDEAERQLVEYFAGDRREFNLPLAPQGTPFQHRVWQAVRAIAWGSTATYGQIAASLCMPPGASRAVGAANGANPIPIIVPCHRIIGSDGRLTGYAGGLSRKALLLSLEGCATEADQLSLFPNG